MNDATHTAAIIFAVQQLLLIQSGQAEPAPVAAPLEEQRAWVFDAK